MHMLSVLAVNIPGITVFSFVSFLCQSTYCSTLYQHCEAVGRSIHIVNLDPAAENFDYPVATGEWGPLNVCSIVC